MLGQWTRAVPKLKYVLVTNKFTKGTWKKNLFLNLPEIDHRVLCPMHLHMAGSKHELSGAFRIYTNSARQWFATM
jgi:hypothetical protein